MYRKFIFLIIFLFSFAQDIYKNINLAKLAERIGFLKQINIVYPKDLNLSSYYFSINLNTYTNSKSLFELFKILLDQKGFVLKRFKDFYLINRKEIKTYNYIYKVHASTAEEITQQLTEYNNTIRILNSKTILVTTKNKKELQLIKNLLKTLDIKTPTYIANLKIAEVSTDFLRNWGINSNTLDTTNGIIYLNQKTYFNFISLLDNNNTANLIASPTLLLAPKSNKPVTNTFIDGQKIPVIKDKTIVVPGNNPVVKTVKEVTYYNVGLELDLTYFNTTQSNKINLFLKFTQSNLLNATENSITTSNREIDTYLSIPLGKPVLLAGLSRKTTNKTIKGIPILKNIPILGYLFKTYKKQIKNSTLVILLEIKELK